MQVKAVSVVQPWADAILYYGKNVENRKWWKARYRGWLVIHASSTRPRPEVMREAVAATGDRTVGSVRGAALGVVELTGVCSPWRCTCRSEWAEPGAYHLHLRNPRPLPEPIPCRGATQLWAPPLEVLAQVARLV